LNSTPSNKWSHNFTINVPDVKGKMKLKNINLLKGKNVMC